MPEPVTLAQARRWRRDLRAAIIDVTSSNTTEVQAGFTALLLMCNEHGPIRRIVDSHLAMLEVDAVMGSLMKPEPT